MVMNLDPTSPLMILVFEFLRLPLVDILTSLPLMAAVIDFDNTDSVWRKYDPITARELFKKFGCSERLYTIIIEPLLQVGLFAPAEQCSAAATLGMMYYFILSHQKSFDPVWCRGRIKEKIFEPWMELMRSQGCKFLKGKRVNNVLLDEETGRISQVACGNENLEADAVIFAVGIFSMQEIIRNSQVNIPNASNICSGFDDSYGWTFFDLNTIYDEHKDDSVTAIQADFYHVNELLPLKDEQIVQKLMSFLSKCIADFDNATVLDQEIDRFPKSLTHFYPGSYKYMMRWSTSFPNLFMAGDSIVNRHGSWSQEKSFVTGLEAANRVVDFLEEGEFAKIVPVEADETHIEVLRGLNRNFNEIRGQLPWSSYFLQ